MTGKIAITKPFVWLLLGLWMLIMLNSVMYRHSHRLPNGKIVSHAHPYKKNADSSPTQPHEHTDEELALLQLIDGQLFAPPAAVALPPLTIYTAQPKDNFGYICSFVALCNSYRDGRAPPQT